jgi:hypothetical protein
MMVPGARSTGDAFASPEVRRVSQHSDAPHTLAYDAHLGAGVHVSVDVMSPDRWQAVSFSVLNDHSRPLLRALIGDGAADRLRAGRRSGSISPGHGVAVDPARAAPWLRIAFVDALDRWLQSPLEQSLVDAERGVSRGFAARTLPEGEVRKLVVGDALRLARRASDGVAAFLRGLARRSQPIPNGLVQACERLYDGYVDLRDHAGARHDRELNLVIRTWRRNSSRLGEAGGETPGDPRLASTRLSPSVPYPPGQPAGVIDPRQVRARVFALAGDPGSAEVTAQLIEGAGPDSVLVRAPAFGRGVDPDVRSRLAVRLVDSRSATPRGHALLSMVNSRLDADDGPCFEATVPLCGLSVSDVRADVFDALSDVPPAGTDGDRSLQEARSAVVFLAEWRRLAALAQVSVVEAPARRLRDLATRLQPQRRRATDRIFPGGPSAADLNELAGLSEDLLLSRLRGDGGPAAGLFAVTSGSARLLVAEIAAACERVDSANGASAG